MFLGVYKRGIVVRRVELQVVRSHHLIRQGSWVPHEVGVTKGGILLVVLGISSNFENEASWEVLGMRLVVRSVGAAR